MQWKFNADAQRCVKASFAMAFALLLVLIDNQGFCLEGFLIDPLDHQGHLVVLVKSGPVFLEGIFGVVEDRHQFRETVEARNRATVGFIGADEMAKTRQGLFVFKRHAFTTGFFAVVTALEDGELVNGRLRILIMNARNARSEVRSVIFVLTSCKGAFEGAAQTDGIIDGIGLVTVRDNLHVGRVTSRIIDNQVRVRKLGFVEGLGLHKTGLRFHFEYAVTAVDATAHDPVNLHVGLAVGAFAEHNAATGIGVFREGLEILFCFVCVCHNFEPCRRHIEVYFRHKYTLFGAKLLNLGA